MENVLYLHFTLKQFIPLLVLRVVLILLDRTVGLNLQDALANWPTDKAAVQGGVKPLSSYG